MIPLIWPSRQCDILIENQPLSNAVVDKNLGAEVIRLLKTSLWTPRESLTAPKDILTAPKELLTAPNEDLEAFKKIRPLTVVL